METKFYLLFCTVKFDKKLRIGSKFNLAWDSVKVVGHTKISFYNL
jgi:hypothetical protein